MNEDEDKDKDENKDEKEMMKITAKKVEEM